MQSKKQHFSSLLTRYQRNALETIKEEIGKSKIKSNNFPQIMLINKTESFDQTLIASSFNNYFANVGPIKSKIPNNGKVFTEYLNNKL